MTHASQCGSDAMLSTLRHQHGDGAGFDVDGLGPQQRLIAFRENVVRGSRGCVDGERPTGGVLLGDLEPLGGIAAVDHHIQIPIIVAFSGEKIRQAARAESPVHGTIGAEPLDVLPPKLRPGDGRMQLAKGDHVLNEPVHLAVVFQPVPVQPGRFAVDLERVVVAQLGLQELIAHAEHRGTVGEHQQAEEILHLPFSQAEDFRSQIEIAFGAAVPSVFVRSVGVVMAVGFVMPAIIGNKIVQREPIMRGDIVHTLKRPEGVHAVVGKQVAAAIQPGHQVSDQTAVAPHELLERIAILGVPLQPLRAGKPLAQQKPAAGVPGFCDQPHVRESRVPGNLIEDGRIAQVHRAVGISRKHGRQVETKPVHAHLGRPVS